ncbi:MAG: hypothetical protein C0408_10440, partial [Odoribacter sp.]|nr:hypothetical protein [Odoribacter sp.]
MNKHPDSQEWFVIVNPNAGNKKGRKDWENISSCLKNNGLIWSEHFTEGKGHAIILTQEAIAAGYRKILCVGGDGTLNEIVNGAFK